MAQGGIQMDQEKLCCSICLEPLRHPVTIPCGHSYCKNCIKSHWDSEDRKEIHSCPQCRKTFRPRPGLVKNTVLADLVEEMQKTQLQAAPTDHSYAGPEDMACDACTGKKQKAVKSCLQCLVSYCDQHLQPHYESPAFKKHKLVDPTKKLQENICARHDLVMKIFCRTDQQCICYLCSMDEHKGHDTVSAAAEMKEKQKELGVSRQRVQQRIQDREKDVKLLQQQLEAINRAAEQAVDDSEKMFTELIHLIEKTKSDVKQQLKSHQKTEVSRVKDLLKKLRQEVTNLRRRDDGLKKLQDTDHYVHFFYNYSSLSDVIEWTESPNISVQPLTYFKDMTAAVSDVRYRLQNILNEEWTKVSPEEAEVDVLLPQPEPQTRSEFLQYSCPVILDPNTAHMMLNLSENNRKASVMEPTFLRAVVTAIDIFTTTESLHFITSPQVLSMEPLTGRCYWEVKWSGEDVSVAMSYKNISRKGYRSEFGNNDKSWVLQCFKNGYEFRHNNISTFISGPQSSRVGVYLDHSAGILSFYGISESWTLLRLVLVSEKMTLLHRVQTTFTQPLFAGLQVIYGSSAELCSG